MVARRGAEWATPKAVGAAPGVEGAMPGGGARGVVPLGAEGATPESWDGHAARAGSRAQGRGGRDTRREEGKEEEGEEREREEEGRGESSPRGSKSGDNHHRAPRAQGRRERGGREGVVREN
jgi:hypothetical protein